MNRTDELLILGFAVLAYLILRQAGGVGYSVGNITNTPTFQTLLTPQASKATLAGSGLPFDGTQSTRSLGGSVGSGKRFNP